MKKFVSLMVLLSVVCGASGCLRPMDKMKETTQNNIQNDDVVPTDFVGTTDNDVYENKYISVGFKLPDKNWVFNDTEALKLLRETAEEAFNVDYDIFEKAKVIGVLSAGSVSGEYAGSHTSIKAEKMTEVLKNASIEEIAESVRMQVIESFAESEIPVSISKMKTTSTEFAGRTCDTLTYELAIDTATLYYISIFVREDDYNFTVTISSDNQAYVDVIKSCYYELESN